ncbi:alanine--tRNA ligase [Alphaproteobacteria bacterium]|nr:alanine--tRNA ligase [Alphaproteobacteria bacterium]
MSSTSDIRTAFLDYFGEIDHDVLPSSPLVPHNDPTLLFTNAGMVQFKNVFTGLEARPYSRAATSQKCVRAGGKHNDLENVGYTARHHTFFEMLGNFSFGDYFKEQAIEFAWNLITTVYGLDKSRLLVTVYHEDQEAFDLWRSVANLPEDRIIRIETSDNFWAMGDTGPCGPCSEIFYDHGDYIAGGPPGSPNEDGDRFIEIWNLVFMQYEQIDSTTRINLPRPSIDTGMGLERIAAVMQGVHDNYDIDLFRALVVASADVANVDVDGPHAVSNRVIADHLRSSSFLMADGVLPSNEGRGYVLRRIMRRAMRHAHMMGCQDPMVYKLVPALIAQMGNTFPELLRAEALITETLKLEETRFKQTLDRGLKLLFEETDKLGKAEPLAGDIAFRLYDTFGFPLDLTEDVLRGQGRAVDTDGFNNAMQRQREDARKAWAGSGDASEDGVWFDIRERLGATEFLGYATEVAEGQVVAIVKQGSECDVANNGEEIAVIVNQTPFYGESGGQQGDAGIFLTADGNEVTVHVTQKRLGDLHVHLGVVTKGKLAVGDIVELRVDHERRSSLRAHHSATHLLHAALRRRLGDHVTQKGSLVAPDRLRFDVSHPKPMSAHELALVASDVNSEIHRNTEVITRLMTPDEAIEAGAMALFGEKYGDEVRVVTMGGSREAPYSVELCGGTHTVRTGDIGLMNILSESAVAAGVRRIDAVTGKAAITHMNMSEGLLNEVADALNVPLAGLLERVKALVEERKRLENELSELRRKLATGGGEATSDGGSKEVAGIKFIRRELDGVPPKELKSLADVFKKQVGSGVIAIAAAADGKASLVVAVTEDLVDRYDAVALVRVGSTVLGGKGGGGRPDMAQAGGSDVSKLVEANDAIEAALAGGD